MTALNYGKPIYSHSSRFSNSILNSIVFVGSISLFLCGVFFSINFQGSVIGSRSDGWYDPATWLFLLAGVATFLTIVLFPYLIIPTNFMITTTGIQTSYSRISRVLYGHPLFIEFRDIQIIFPQFIPGLPLPDGTKGMEVLYSLVVILKDGRRVEMMWNAIGSFPTPTQIIRFLDMFLCFPEELKEKWSDIPVLTEEEERISRRMDKKGSEDIVSCRFIIIVTVTFITFAVFIFCIVLEIVFKVRVLWLDFFFFPYLFLLILSIISMLIVVIIDANRFAKVQVNRRVLKELEKGNDIHIKEGRWALRTGPDDFFYEPINDEELRNSIKEIGRFSPLLSKTVTSIGISFIIVSFLFYIFSEEFIPKWNVFNLIITSILVFIGISCLVSGIAVLGNILNKRHISYIDAAIADEVRMGKEILPKGYVLPKWFLLTRGPIPLTLNDIGKIRKWTRFKQGQRNFIAIGLISGGCFFLIFFYLVMLVYPLPEIFLVICLIIEIITLPMGILYLIKTTNAFRKLDRAVRWEKRSGIRLLPDDLRKRWLDWIVEEGYDQ